jgi:hypothetical protein
MASHQFLLTFSALHCAPPNRSTVIGEAVANHIRVMLEIGSKGKRVIKDPDHNLLMICQRNPDTTDIATK